MSEDLKLALFDYDGTIVDSAIMIVKGAIEAFRMCGLPDPDPKKVRENIGKPLAIALDDYMPPGFDVTPKQISDAYRSWYANPAMAIKAMNDLGVQKQRCVMIGDTINDIGLGVNAGIISIGVTWGYNSKELLSSAGASYLVNDSIELSKLMKTICP